MPKKSWSLGPSELVAQLVEHIRRNLANKKSKKGCIDVM
jgi:hypothetical protein